MTLLRMIYTSHSLTPVTEDELLAIACSSAVRNANDGITGMLLYHRSTYVQMIEGPPDAVRALYLRLRKDPRHKSLRVFFEGEVPQRDCPDWGMRLQGVEAVHEGRLLLREPLPPSGHGSNTLSLVGAGLLTELTAS